jgi:thiol-disulfide isomerase/thioredoxin
LRPWLAAVLAAIVFAFPSAPVQAKLPVGSAPPDVLGKSLANDAITVGQFHGRVVIVTFWASWCGPCRRELPALDALKQVAGDRAEIVAVNVKDPTPDYHAITRQLKGTGLIFTHDSNGKIAEAYGVDAYPNLFVIDQTGRIANVHVGYGEGALESIVAEINALLAHPAVAKN